MKPKSSISSKLIGSAVAAAGTWWAISRLLAHHRRWDLRGRTVLITGGSRGLGLALARRCAKLGAHIAICARDEKELRAVESELTQSGAMIKAFECDLTDSVQASALIDRVESAMGPIDAVINNAATIIVGPAQNMTIDDFRQAMDLNFWAAVHLTLAVAPRMKTRGGGRIVNIASIGGKVPVPHLAPYCASKFALVGFSGAMRAELAVDGILVTTVNPGLLRTGSPRNADFKGNQSAEYAWFALSDALPGASMDADTAAEKVIEALVTGVGEITLGLPAQIAGKLYGIAPSLNLELASLINCALPREASAADGGNTIAKGRDRESWITRLLLPGSGRDAEKRFNELQS